MGLCFALKKQTSYVSFILRRFQRILPAFLLVSIPWFYYENIHMGGRDISTFLINVSTMGFWVRNDLSCWYVSAILALYLITPVYMKLWKRWPWLNTVSILAVCAVIFLVPISFQRDYLSGRMVMLYRLPVFLMGLSLGKAIQEGKVFRLHILIPIAAAAVSLAGVAMALGRTPFVIPGEYKYLAYAPLTVVLSLLCAKIPANPVTDFLGNRSLEVYLLHEKVQQILDVQPWMWRLTERSPLVYPLVTLGVTMVAAEILHLFCKWIVSIRLGKPSLDNPERAR